MSVEPLEAVWVGVNLLAIILTLWNLAEAHKDRDTVHRANGRAREIAVTADFNREVLRLLMLACLTSVALPGLFIDRAVVLSPALLALMAVPFLIFAQSALDARARRNLVKAVAEETK